MSVSRLLVVVPLLGLGSCTLFRCLFNACENTVRFEVQEGVPDLLVDVVAVPGEEQKEFEAIDTCKPIDWFYGGQDPAKTNVRLRYTESPPLRTRLKIYEIKGGTPGLKDDDIEVAKRLRRGRDVFPGKDRANETGHLFVFARFPDLENLPEADVKLVIGPDQLDSLATIRIRVERNRIHLLRPGE